MDDLVTWLRAQLDDDTETFDALDSTALNGIESTAGWSAREYIERGRAEVNAKRDILDEHSPQRMGYFVDLRCEGCLKAEPCPTVRLLALPYADRPGYRDEWRP